MLSNMLKQQNGILGREPQSSRSVPLLRVQAEMPRLCSDVVRPLTLVCGSTSHARATALMRKYRLPSLQCKSKVI